MAFEVNSVYELEGWSIGKPLFLVAPGPTSEDFPLDSLQGRNVIALNCAIEILPFTPSFWMFADRAFITRIYPVRIKEGDPPQIIVSKKHLGWMSGFGGQAVYYYRFYGRRLNVNSGFVPWWRWRARSHLEGRKTIATLALSLAMLMRPTVVFLIGVDFQTKPGDGGEYVYNRSVTGKPNMKIGSFNDQRLKSHARGVTHMHRGFSRNNWKDLSIKTLSSSLSKEFPQIGLVSVDEALNGCG